ALVADEGPVDRALPDQLGSHVGRRTVQVEPLDEALGPRRVAPYELALRIVERALDDRGSRELVQVCRSAHVVGVEVGHADGRAPAARLSESDRPRRLRGREPDARIDQRPAVVAWKKVGMDVPGARGQRQRDAPDAGDELVHRATLLGAAIEHMFY